MTVQLRRSRGLRAAGVEAEVRRRDAAMAWKVLLPTLALVAFVTWALVDRNLAALQVVGAIPFAYILLYFTVGAVAYRSTPRASDETVADDALPFVSVLVPAHNEEAVIGHTLEHVLRLQYPRLEVIVIDDASTDRTGEVVRGFPVRLVTRSERDRRGKSEALNAGLAVARGEVICVFDADSEMAPDFLRLAVVPLVRDAGVCGVQGQVRMYNRRQNVLTRSQDDEFAIHNEILQLGRERLGGASALGGNGQLTRRSALERVGAWSPTSLTEDLDLTMRLFLAGCGRIAHCTRAIVWQEGVPTVRALLRQRTRWAEGILRCYGDYAGPVLASRHMTRRLRVDAFWALFSVFLPILSVAGLAFTLLNAIPGFFVRRLPDEMALWLSVLMLSASCIGSMTVSWKRDRRVTLMPAVRYVVYVLHWVPAFALALRNVLRGRAGLWQKTEHAWRRLPDAGSRRDAVPEARPAGTPVGLPVATRV